MPTFKALIDAQQAPDYAADSEAPSFPFGIEITDFGKNRKPVYKFRRDPLTGKFDDSQLVAEMVQVIEDPICMLTPPSIFETQDAN